MNLMSIDITAESVLQSLWRASWQAMVLAGVVLLIQWLLGSRVGGRGRYLLWSVVILRLMLPVLPPSPLSIYNLGRAASLQDKVEAVPVIPESVTALRETPAIAASIDIPSTPRETNTPTAAAWTIAQILLLVWLLGAAFIVMRLIAASLSWNRSIGPLRPMVDPHLKEIVATAARDLSVRRLPGVFVGEQVPTPAVVGLLRPRLLLPARVVSDCTAREVRLIVLHELAHVKRRDIAANWLLAAACIVHWFNPLVWLTAARIRTDRELACDETVLAACQASDSQAYGHTLLRLIEILSPGSADRHPQLVGILESSAPMQRRMRMIARYSPQSSSRWAWIIVVLLVLGCTSLTDSVRGQAPQAASPATRPAAEPAQPPGGEVTLQAQLRKVVPEIQFDGVEFTKVIDFYRDIAGANIFVNWRALETAGIDREAHVTLRLRGVPLEQALRRTLHEVGGGAVRLAYTVEGNVLTITTEEDAASETRTVLYDVSDLLVGSDGKPLPVAERQQMVDAMILVITDTLARESWRDNGGSVGSAREFNGKLIITQTPENHDQIDKLLVRIREKPSTRPRPLSE